jgi:membrane protease YdiL (CAAX protease family)
VAYCYICPARNKQRKNNHFDWMEEFGEKVSRRAWISAVMIMIVTLIGFYFIGPLIGFLIVMPFVEISFMDFMQQLATPLDHPEVKIPYFIIQGSATFVGLVLIPFFYARGIEKINPLTFFSGKINGKILLLTAGIIIFFMGFNSVVIDWNSKITFPEFLKDFEMWARRTEDLATEITKFLTQFDSPLQFILALFVIAVFAGIGEELVFRGLLQPALHRLTKNIHVAIWLSAILFSTLHLQFFGFVPRVLLGALFGYLYYWSGNLAVPMFAHFVNNALGVVAVYLVQKGVTDMDVETTEAYPLSIVISFTLLTIVLILIFRKQFTNQSPA